MGMTLETVVIAIPWWVHLAFFLGCAVLAAIVRVVRSAENKSTPSERDKASENPYESPESSNSPRPTRWWAVRPTAFEILVVIAIIILLISVLGPAFR